MLRIEAHTVNNMCSGTVAPLVMAALFENFQDTAPSKALLRAVKPFRNQESRESESEIWMMNTPNCCVEQRWSMLTVEIKCRSSQDGSWGGMLAGPPSPEKGRRLQTGMTRSNSQTVGILDPVSVSDQYILTCHCCIHDCPYRESIEPCSAGNVLDSLQ